MADETPLRMVKGTLMPCTDAGPCHASSFTGQALAVSRVELCPHPLTAHPSSASRFTADLCSASFPLQPLPAACRPALTLSPST